MRIVDFFRKKKNNLFLTDREVNIIWKEASYYPKLQIMLGFALFRGLRIGEIRAINIRDFKNSSFSKIDVIVQKSNIKDEFPIMEEFAVLLKQFIKTNVHTFTGGYFFPHYKKFNMLEPYIDKQTVNTMFYKFRRDHLIPKYPQFSERIDYIDDETGKLKYNRHRVAWHSCRRWFITKLWENGYNEKEISDVLRYQDVRTVFTYIDCYKTWKKEKEILEETFGDVFKECLNFSEGQKQLGEFIA